MSTSNATGGGDYHFADLNMTKDKRQHNWTKAQPHHAVTGKITTKKFALNNPSKVEWVKVKKATSK